MFGWTYLLKRYLGKKKQEFIFQTNILSGFCLLKFTFKGSSEIEENILKYNTSKQCDI